jgi:hypothetical protein
VETECTCGLYFLSDEDFEAHVQEELEADGCIRRWDVATI